MESAAERPRASEAGLEAKADIVANKERLGTAELVDLV